MKILGTSITPNNLFSAQRKVETFQIVELMLSMHHFPWSIFRIMLKVKNELKKSAEVETLDKFVMPTELFLHKEKLTFLKLLSSCLACATFREDPTESCSKSNITWNSAKEWKYWTSSTSQVIYFDTKKN